MQIESFNIVDWVLMGGLALAGVIFLYQLYFYIRYMAGVQRRVRHQSKGRFRWKVTPKATNNADEENAEPVQESGPKGCSVVVCAKNEGENLRNYLQALLTQDYPLYEVIVVNDASEDNTQLVLEHYQQRYPRLHITFVPANAWVRSSKKLALTLAAKAAKYDYLLLTDADCVPETPHWITEMMHGFDRPETEIVLGYGGYFQNDQLVNRRIQYDTIFTAMQWLGMAMSRHPYMGVGRNLAYKKSLFFHTGGFAGLLNYRAGDDDLLVNKLATAQNTEVVLTPNSYTWSVPKATIKDWRIQKYRHLSVSPAYKTSTKLRIGFEPFTRGLWYILLVAIAILASITMPSFTSLPDWLWATQIWVPAAALLLFLVRWFMQWAMLNRAAHIFGVSGFNAFRVLWSDIFFPINNAVMLLRHRLRRKDESKW